MVRFVWQAKLAILWEKVYNDAKGEKVMPYHACMKWYDLGTRKKL